MQVSQVVLITGYSNTGEQVFAAIDAANGNILWQKDEFFFEATSATALNFAVNVNETKAYTAQFISSGTSTAA